MSGNLWSGTLSSPTSPGGLCVGLFKSPREGQVLALLVLAVYACVHVHPCLSVNTNLSRGEGFPGGISGKDPTCLCRRCKRCGFNPWVGKSPWRRALQPTPVFLPGDPMDRGAWGAIVHGVAKSRIQLKPFSTSIMK